MASRKGTSGTSLAGLVDAGRMRQRGDMRHILVLLLCLVAFPAAAQDWSTYVNARHGYAIDIPPGYRGQGEPANGHGQVFRSASGTREIRVYGRTLTVPEFDTDVRNIIRFATDEGWRVSYERITPSWASFSGLRNGLVLYVRMIALCGGDQNATVELRYPERDIRTMDGVIERVARSLRATSDTAAC